MHRRWEEWLMRATAGFVLAWVTARAAVQSITYDEAFTYLNFAKSLHGVLWFNSNNHMLNSWLMWGFTSAFGPSNLTLRAPALLGAVIYTTACYVFCRRITHRIVPRWALFVCLTCNPFVMDFMAAARGYSLANAFLTVAVVIPLLYPPTRWTCMAASAALGLSFTANFSFAFAAACAFLALLAWAMRGRGADSIWSVAARCVLPGLLVTLALCGYTLVRWQGSEWQGELWWGARSLAEMRDSLMDSSFYRISPRFPYAAQAQRIQPWLTPVLAALCLVQAAAVRPRIGTLVGIAAGSIGLSWAAFHLANLPLPIGRTGLYLVTLCTLLAGVIAVAPVHNKLTHRLRHAIVATLACIACYFLLCLRTSHFREYPEDAGAREVYERLASMHRLNGVTDIQAAGVYVTALNYYREISGPETLPPFEIGSPEIAPGHAVYVLHQDYWKDFIAQQRLRIVYSNDLSKTAIAVASRAGNPDPEGVVHNSPDGAAVRAR